MKSILDRGLVQGVTGASAAPGFGGLSPMPIRSDEKVLRAKPFYVSPNFLSVMGIEVLSGQGFDPNLPHGVLLNETAARFFGPEDPIGRTLTLPNDNDEPMTVIGVVEDFHFVNMRHTIGPAFLTTLMPTNWRGDRFSHTLFRLDGANLPAAVEEVKALWKRVLPEYELWRVRFLDERFAAEYGDRAAHRSCHAMDECRCHCNLLHGAFWLGRLSDRAAHQGNWHPQGIGGYDQQRAAVDVARIRLAGGGGQCRCLAGGLFRLESLARVLCLPH